MKDIRLSILKTISLVLIALAFVLFALSLFEPVFVTEEKMIKGYWVLAMGWLGFVIFQFAWYANLLSMLAILMMFKRAGAAFLLSLLAMLVSAQSFMFDEIPAGSDGQSIKVIDTDIGLYLWIGAHCAVLYAAILMLIRKKMLEHEKRVKVLKREQFEREVALYNKTLAAEKKALEKK